MKNTASKLQEFLNNGYKGIVTKSSLAYQAINHLANGLDLKEAGKVSTVSMYSRGCNDFTNIVCMILGRLKINYTVGNDAPRGGVNGKFVQITVKSFIEQRKKEIAAELERIKAEEAAKALEAAKAAKLAEIEKNVQNACTYNKTNGILANGFTYDWETFRTNINRCKREQRAAWFQLSQAIGVANNGGLRKAISEYLLNR